MGGRPNSNDAAHYWAYRVQDASILPPPPLVPIGVDRLNVAPGEIITWMLVPSNTQAG